MEALINGARIHYERIGSGLPCRPGRIGPPGRGLLGDFTGESIPHSRKAIIHDAAHPPNLEHPEEFNRIVLDFLKAD